MISLRTLFSMASATASLFFLIPSGRASSAAAPPLDDELDERQLVEGRHLLALVGLDVRVDQVPHGRLVHLQIDVVAAGQLHLAAYVLVVADLGLERVDLDGRVSCFGQLVAEVGERADEGGHVLVESESARLVGLELFGVA
jgi:hypothetical protein